MIEKTCLNCGKKWVTKFSGAKYCCQKCGSQHRWKISHKVTDNLRPCRNCGKLFSVTPIQNQKWLCSDECRKARNAKIIREWHTRNPERELIYRARTKEKQTPDSNIKRFYAWNPSAPRKCESCGESRVLEIAHKPGKERNGRGRCKENSHWPSHVWVLCPTCHRLLDRMRYPPSDLGLF